MLIIEMAKLELTGGHIWFIVLYRLPKWNWIYDNYQDKILVNVLIIDIPKIELTGGHIKIMLIIEITKLELTGGHIKIMLIIEMAKIE